MYFRGKDVDASEIFFDLKANFKKDLADFNQLQDKFPNSKYIPPLRKYFKAKKFTTVNPFEPSK